MISGVVKGGIVRNRERRELEPPNVLPVESPAYHLNMAQRIEKTQSPSMTGRKQL